MLRIYSGILLCYALFMCFFSTLQSSPDFNNTGIEALNSSVGSETTPKECSCGENSFNCFFTNERKVCLCHSGYSQTDETIYGECKKCDCGPRANGCHFYKNDKICSCPKGFSSASGKCYECDCGPNSVSCEHIVSILMKNCTCKKGYEPKGKIGSALHESCERCDCGRYSKSCKFKAGGMKECTCKPGSSVILGGLLEGDRGCKVCDCGENAISCSINSYGDKKCNCKHGFTVTSLGPSGDYCKRCDCGPHSISCSFGFSGERLCWCEHGYYSKKKSLLDSNEDCIPNDMISYFPPKKNKARNNGRGWKYATYAVAAVYGVIIIGLLKKICHKKTESS